MSKFNYLIVFTLLRYWAIYVLNFENNLLAFLSSRVPTLPKSRDRNLNIVRMKSILFSFKGLSAPRNPEIVSEVRVDL